MHCVGTQYDLVDVRAGKKCVRANRMDYRLPVRNRLAALTVVMARWEEAYVGDSRLCTVARGLLNTHIHTKTIPKNHPNLAALGFDMHQNLAALGISLASKFSCSEA